MEYNSHNFPQCLCMFEGKPQGLHCIHYVPVVVLVVDGRTLDARNRALNKHNGYKLNNPHTIITV